MCDFTKALVRQQPDPVICLCCLLESFRPFFSFVYLSCFWISLCFYHDYWLGFGKLLLSFSYFTFLFNLLLVTINSPSFDHATIPHWIHLVFSHLLHSFLKLMPSLIYSTCIIVTINHCLLNVTIPIQVMRILYQTS